MNKVWVVPAVKGRVACWDVNAVHPGGEIFIHWDELTDDQPDPVEVYATPGVLDSCAKGFLTQVLPPGLEVKAEVAKEAALKSLVAIKGIGQARAEELYDLGIVDAMKLSSLNDEEMFSVAEATESFSISQLQDWHRNAVEKVHGGK